MKKKIIIISSIVVVLIGGAFAVFHKAPPEMKFKPVRFEQGDILVTVSASGEVEPKNRLEVKPPVSGRLEELFVEEGDLVEKGQIIGQYSSSERVALIDTARAQGAKELARWKNLYKAIPITAPITGTVISRDAEPGQTLETSDSLVIISDRLMVTAQVDETDVAKIKKGLSVSIALDAYPKEKIAGVVGHVAFEATTEENVTVYNVNVFPDEIPEFMKSGMSVEVLFNIQEKKNVKFINTSELLFDDQGAYVFTQGNEHHFLPLYLKTGLQADGKTEILGNLNIEKEYYTSDISLASSPGEEGQSSNPFMPKGPGPKPGKKSGNRK